MVWRKAKWIWQREKTSQQNYFLYFRKNVSVSKSNITYARLHISADSRYVLYLNGEYLGQGPARSFPEHQQYDTYQITDMVKKGKNIIAGLAHHFGISTFQYIHGRGALICELEIKYSTGKIEFIGSDKTWKMKPCNSYNRFVPRISVQLGFEEQFDVRKEIPGWKKEEFSDKNWENAVELGKAGIAPWKKLEPRDIPFLTADTIFPVKIIQSEVVCPTSYNLTLNLRQNFIGEEKNANRKRIIGFIFTYIYAKKNEKIILYQLPPFYAPQLTSKFRINGQVFINKDAFPLRTNKVSLKPGWNLLLIELNAKGEYHDFDYALAIESKQELLFNCYQEKNKNSLSFATIDGFSSNTAGELETIWKKGPDAVSKFDNKNIRIKPIAKKNLYCEDIFLKTLLDRPEKNLKPKIDSPEALCSSNFNKTIIYPQTKSNSDTRILLDFGKEIVGYSEFEVITDEPGVIFDFNLFEAIEDGKIHWTSGVRNSFRYISKKGTQTYRTYSRRGFRYAYLIIRNNKFPVKIRYVSCLLNTFPVVEKGEFNCSDVLLDRIWEVGKWTVRLCMEDTYVDCPAYEQTHWVGDARCQALVNHVAFGAYDLTRHCLDQVSHSFKYNYLPESHVPSGWRNIIPAWTFLWVWSIYEYYLYTGDKDFIKKIYPYLKKTCTQVNKLLSSRKLIKTNAWNLLDWAPMDTPNEGEITHNSMMAVKVLALTAKLARMSGHLSDEKKYKNSATKIKKATNKYLWSEKKKAYIDSIHEDGTYSSVISQQTNTMAYLCDCAEDKRKETIRKYITEPSRGFVKTGSPFFTFFTLESLAKSGQIQSGLNLIRKKYSMMLNKGATTWWETFPGHEKHWWTRSHCHGWSSGPTYFLSTEILGINPVEPGFKKVLVAPHPCDLKWAKGNFPTPYGEIKVSWEITRDRFKLEVGSPKECRCKIKLPESKLKPQVVIKYY